MNTTSTYGRKKAAVGVGALLLLGASLLTVSAVVGAQATGSFSGDSPDDFNPLAYCSADSIFFGAPGETPAFFGSEDDGNHLLSRDVPGNGSTQLAPVAVALPEGTYSLLGVASDAYPTRGGVSQAGEQWFAEFVDASGAVVGTSATTPDVPDLAIWGIVSASLGEVTLTGDAAAVVIKHANPGTASPNSLRAICMDIDLVSLTTSIDSSITVDYDSTNVDPADITVTCDTGSETGSDTAVDLVIDPVTPGTSCVVEYPADYVCTVVVTPDDQVSVTAGDGTVTVAFPADMSVDALVDIDCSDTEVLDATVDCTDAAAVEAAQAAGDTSCDVDCSDAEAAAAAAAAGDDSCDEAVDCSDAAAVEAAEAAGDTSCDVDCTDAEAAAAAAAAGDNSCDPDVLNETVTNPDTDTPETEVLQEVVDAPVAQSQAGDPTFTG